MPGELAPESPAAARRGPVKCSFCECTLDAEGTIVRMGAEAKKLEKAVSDLEAAREKLTAADATIEQLRADLAAAQTGPAPASRDDAGERW